MGCCKKMGFCTLPRVSQANSAPPPAPGPAKIPGPVLFFFGGGFPRGIYRTWRHVLGRFTTGRPPGLDKPKLVSSPQTSMYHPPEIQQKST